MPGDERLKALREMTWPMNVTNTVTNLETLSD